MKNIMSIAITGIMLLSVACSDWLDVNPKTDVKSEEMFKDESGFKSALIGIYGRMTKDETYGLQLSFGFIERLVQRYDNSLAGKTDEERAKIYNYTEESAPKNSISLIWNEMYKTIANINNLLKYLETNGDVITTPGYRDMIKGEALGLRAFHYFDLLRLWGPIYEEDSTALTIPWRDQFTPDKVPQMPANELARKILNDLWEAERLLENDGMIYNYNYTEPFLGERKHRMNKYAVKALLARVYLWIGNREQAALYAKDVIDHCGLNLVNDNRLDVAMYEETLFGLEIYEMEDRHKSYWTESSELVNDREYWITSANAQSVFEVNTVGLNDIRYKAQYGFNHNAKGQLMCRKYLPTNQSLYEEKQPLIRLSEMYYILAESVTLSDSPQYINAVRNVRGISYNNNIQAGPEYTSVVRITELQKEYQKDFFAEGQFFYFLKRHHAKTFWRCPVQDFDAYVFPIPDDEVEFGSIVTE